MLLTKHYSQDQLVQIIDQATIYMCACPAQVCEQILHLRNLYDYQNACSRKSPTNIDIHPIIAEAVTQAHALLEDCLTRILTLEKWDMTTLEMPADLRAIRTEFLASAEVAGLSLDEESE